MKRYRIVVGPVRFGPGQVLHLSPEQVRLRAHNLTVGKPDKKTGAVAVTVANPVEFKRGEVIGIEGISRALEGHLEDADKAPAEPAPAPKADVAAAVAAERRRAEADALAALDGLNRRWTDAWREALPRIVAGVADELGLPHQAVAAALKRELDGTFPDLAAVLAAPEEQPGQAPGPADAGPKGEEKPGRKAPK